MANIVKNRLVLLATFHGSTGRASLGYIKGQRYLLTVEFYSNGAIVILPEKTSQNSPKPCEYQSVVGFYNNWVNISQPGVQEAKGVNYV